MSWKETARDPLPTAGRVPVTRDPAHHWPWGSFPPGPPAHCGPCARYLGTPAHRWPCAHDPGTPCPPWSLCLLSGNPAHHWLCAHDPGTPCPPRGCGPRYPGPPASHRPLHRLGQVNPPKSGLYAGPLAASRATETRNGGPLNNSSLSCASPLKRAFFL